MILIKLYCFTVTENADSLLAQELERRDREAQKEEEEKEFKRLQASELILMIS